MRLTLAIFVTALCYAAAGEHRQLQQQEGVRTSEQVTYQYRVRSNGSVVLVPVTSSSSATAAGSTRSSAISNTSTRSGLVPYTGTTGRTGRTSGVYGTIYTNNNIPLGTLGLVALTVTASGRVIDEYGLQAPGYYVDALGRIIDDEGDWVDSYDQIIEREVYPPRLTSVNTSPQVTTTTTTRPPRTGIYSQVCCVDCNGIATTAERNDCLANCERVCVTTASCVDAGQQAYNQYCQDRCLSVEPPFSQGFLGLSACSGECAADVQARCQNRCREFGNCAVTVDDCLRQASTNCFAISS